MFLNIVWFILVAVLIAGYAILDGFDFGVGVLHLFTKDEREKRVNINSIGPVWDGNEVWLLTGGGALFAAFPKVYASVFSGFYIALMLLLVALIFRAVSLEFRSKVDSPGWRKFWDYAFGLGSLLPAVLFGVAIGNIMRGIPIDDKGDFTGTFFTLLNPYSIAIGVLSLVLFTLHGSLFLLMKTEGEQKERVKKLAPRLWMIFVLLYSAITIWSISETKHLFIGVVRNPILWIFVLLLIGGIYYIPLGIRKEKFGLTFFCSSTMIGSMIGLIAIGLFPILVPSTIDPTLGLNIINAASTQRTLLTMFIIALIGMPIVIGYTIFIYRKFKGKVELDENSY